MIGRLAHPFRVAGSVINAGFWCMVMIVVEAFHNDPDGKAKAQEMQDLNAPRDEEPHP